MNDNLKRCPFCGAKLKRGVFDKEMFYEHLVVNGCILRQMMFTEKQWNKRPLEDELESDIEILESELDTLLTYNEQLCTAIQNAIDEFKTDPAEFHPNHKLSVSDSVIETLTNALIYRK